jgi:hypothetical protein
MVSGRGSIIVYETRCSAVVAAGSEVPTIPATRVLVGVITPGAAPVTIAMSEPAPSVKVSEESTEVEERLSVECVEGEVVVPVPPGVTERVAKQIDEHRPPAKIRP